MGKYKNTSMDPTMKRVRRDFAMGIALTAIVPLLVAVYMASVWLPAARLHFALSTTMAWALTIVLALTGIQILWRYVWATVELRSHLREVAARDLSVPVSFDGGACAPWLLKHAMTLVLSEYRKQVYALQAEKAVMERRLITLSGGNAESDH